jgi:hypothetical protein
MRRLSSKRKVAVCCARLAGRETGRLTEGGPEREGDVTDAEKSTGYKRNGAEGQTGDRSGLMVQVVL